MIKRIVQSVLKCMVPSADVGSIQLPSKSCGDYMCRDELPTVSRAHKADYLGSAESIALNSDGTTKHQQKKAASIMNGMVLGVHDVANWSADAALQAIRSEMEIIQTIAEELGSSTSALNATAKLIGEHGAPEYCQGKIFRIVLKSKQKDCEYKDLAKVHLARQVVSRYYVTSYNAG